MDKTIRKNEICAIGLPRCDFVFSSTRTCFIAYGFEQSPLEMAIVKRLLEERGIEGIEAGGQVAPGQYAFCAKICSKIIAAQFCIVLLNNEVADGREIPNANVNMEYGLMIGFNKCVIPFQRASQQLPFNVAGLDTIKYSDRDFEVKAKDAIDHAIRVTAQSSQAAVSVDQQIQAFLLSRRTLIATLNNEGEKNLFELGSPLGFNLLNDFAGLTVVYFGNFTLLRPEVVLAKMRLLNEILISRRSSIPQRVQMGAITPEKAGSALRLLADTKIWVLVTSELDKQIVHDDLARNPSTFQTEVFCLNDVSPELSR